MENVETYESVDFQNHFRESNSHVDAKHEQRSIY